MRPEIEELAPVEPKLKIVEAVSESTGFFAGPDEQKIEIRIGFTTTSTTATDNYSNNE